VLAACLSSLNIEAPEQADDDIHALHRYRPRPFRAENDWEEYWDNPPRLQTSALEKMKGMAMSMDALNAKKPKEVKNKGLKEKKSMYSSTPTLDKLPESVHGSRNSLNEFSNASSVSSESTRPRSKTHEMLVGEPIKEAKVHELNRSRELSEKPLVAPKPSRKYERNSTDSAKSTPVERRKSISQQSRIYPLNEISDADSEVEPRIAALTYAEIQRNGSPMPNRNRDSRGSPTSILKRKPSDYESPRVHRHNKLIDDYSSTSGRSTPTRTSPIRQEIVPLTQKPPVAPKPHGRYVNAEVQTEPIFSDNYDQPLINSPSRPQLKQPTPQEEDDFDRNVDKLRRMSKSPAANHKPSAPRQASLSSSSSFSDKENGHKDHYDVNDSDSWEECSDKISPPKLVMNHDGTRLYTVDLEEHEHRF
uniref:Uncharacterized protein n=1 Tax=Acrobeloides nanus TaxID=290746 RepID=A0A914CJW2_9BILA